MIRPGLCSVTFRALSVREVIALAADAQLAGIEWGGDIHVPPGDRALAREVRKATQGEGLAVSSYGSYYRAGVAPRDGHPFERVLESAVELGAPVIRIWAGDKNYDDATPAEIEAVVDDTRRIVGLAQAASVTLAYEFHQGTLTQRTETAVTVAGRIPNLRLYWQPPDGATVQAALASLEALFPRLGNLHVFHWVVEGDGTPPRMVWRPLEEGAASWRHYLRAAASVPGDRWALLEFVKDHDPAQFLRDAKTLTTILSGRP